MDFDSFLDTLRKAIETDLKLHVAQLDEPDTRVLYEMITDHMGWTGKGAGPDAQGKRLRPTILLLTLAACGLDWVPALPAATAVELVHNFSLVHDDIQDASEKRHGRMTVWKKWGMPQGINTGDAIFVLSNLSILGLSPHYPSPVVYDTARILHDTCLDLTRGQFLDISYETRLELKVEDYWPMASGKTAALFAACTKIGSLLGGESENSQNEYRKFGYYLGLSFQVQDDWLGIWGNEALTGKSTSADLTSSKKSLPILFGLERSGTFANKYSKIRAAPDDVPMLANLLDNEGAKQYTEKVAAEMKELALKALHAAKPKGDAGEFLYVMAEKLLSRNT